MSEIQSEVDLMSLYPISAPARASAFVDAVTLGNSPVVAVPLPLVHLLDDWVAAIFLSQCMYHASNTGGSFARTHGQWKAELGLSPDQVRRCLKTCAGVIVVERRGIPARNIYRVDYAELANRLAALQPGTDKANDQVQNMPTTSDWEALPPVVRKSRDHTSYKKLEEQPTRRDDVRPLPSHQQEDLTTLLGVWNTNRKTLPEATGLTAPRKRALSDLLRECGGDVEVATSLLADATKEVAQDEFWQAKRFGLDILLPKVQGRAEAWRSRHILKDDVQPGIPWAVGERVTYRREHYHIEAVTDTFIDLFDELNGSVRVTFNSDDIRAVRMVCS